MSDFMFWALIIFVILLVVTAITVMAVVNYRTKKEMQRIEKDMEEQERTAKIKEEHIRLARQRHIARACGEKVPHVKDRFNYDDNNTEIRHTRNCSSTSRNRATRARASRDAQDAAAINAATSVIFFN